MTGAFALSDSDRAAAIEAFRLTVERVGQTRFAEVCGCTQSNISQLLSKKSVLPDRYVLRVERELGTSRHALRPDLYPHDESSTVLTVPVAGKIGSGNRISGLQLGDPAR